MKNKDKYIIPFISDPSNMLVGRNPHWAIEEAKRKLNAGESITIFDIGHSYEPRVEKEMEDKEIRVKKRRYV